MKTLLPDIWREVQKWLGAKDQRRLKVHFRSSGNALLFVNLIMDDHGGEEAYNDPGGDDDYNDDGDVVLIVMVMMTMMSI